MDRVTVYDVPNEGKGCLGRDVWVFQYFDRMGLVLDYYTHEERNSAREKFKARSVYNRLSHNRSRDYTIRSIEEKDAPLPDWVVVRAREIFMHHLTVRKWQDGTVDRTGAKP